MKNYHTYQSGIEACLHCATLCHHCASSCAKEDEIKMMALCIQLDMECAAICFAAAQFMSLGSEKANDICKLCAEVCEACGAECGQHQNAHCAACALACKACAEACQKMAA